MAAKYPKRFVSDVAEAVSDSWEDGAQSAFFNLVAEIENIFKRNNRHFDVLAFREKCGNGRAKVDYNNISCFSGRLIK